MKRSGKFYYSNEADVMEEIGLRQVPGSGSTWVSREDGENENVLCQLKSTESGSIRIERKDIKSLEYHAAVAHKIPVFAVQFIESGDIYLMVKPGDLYSVSEYLGTGEKRERKTFADSQEHMENIQHSIRSDSVAREHFYSDSRKKWKRGVVNACRKN